MDLLELLPHVERIAHDAGDILMKYYGKPHRVEQKGPGDVVTEADKESEEYVRAALEQLCPGHAILGEEFGLEAGSSEYCWAIDPLDGTANYAKHVPIFAVSIGLLRQGEPVLGVIFDPNTNSTYSAVTGHGATCNSQAIKVNDHPAISPEGHFGVSSRMVMWREAFLESFRQPRCLGSAALQMCYIAAGYFDGTIDCLTKLWDVAAGTVIVREAGGRVTTPTGEPAFPLPNDSDAYRGGAVAFVATNGRLHEECTERYRASLSADN